MRRTNEMKWPAPARGWITAGNITTAPLDGAERLDNFFPTAQGAELRAGCVKHATLDATCRRFMAHRYGDPKLLFGCTDSDIYEISSPADADVTPVAKLTGLGSGDWSHIQFANAGGVFMVGVNGTDHAVYHDGTTLNPLVDETVYDLTYDALSADFTVGQTVTGGTSGASAEIIAIAPTSATAGVLKIGAITSGPFQDNEALTDGSAGAATANIPSGTSTASTVTITNVATAALSQVWIWKERVFFVEKGTQSIWYLPVESIGGAASEINLGSVFNMGGNVLFGANWSLDSGEGLDDKMIVVTDQGEIAVYGGTDPASASTFTLDGVYRIGRPLDKHSWFSMGGELLIVTEDGIVAVSHAIAKDRSSVIRDAITAPIEDVWQDTVASHTATSPAAATIWHSAGKLYVASPQQYEGQPVVLVANTRTGAWARYVGWDMRSSIVFNGNMYFGSDGGIVYQGDVGGTDAGTAYTGVFVPKFTDCGIPGIKVVNHVAITGRSVAGMTYAAKVMREFEVSEITPPVPVVPQGEGGVWGTSSWGAFAWGASKPVVGSTKWKAYGGKGYYLALGVAVTCNQDDAPRILIIALKMRFESGAAF